MGKWKNRPEGSNWGEFGPDDQIGRMNYVTAERRRAAARAVKEGVSYCLSLPLDYPGWESGRKPPKLFAANWDGLLGYNFEMSNHYPDCDAHMCDDGVVLYTQYSSQWDALCHWGAPFDADGDGIAEKCYYNGFTDKDMVAEAPDGTCCASRLGIENLAVSCPQGRGVLVNLKAVYGTAQRAIGYADLMRAMELQNVVVEKGDFLLLYTGLDEMILSMHKKPDIDRIYSSCCFLEGDDERLLQWISESGIAVIASDNIGVEHFPIPGPNYKPRRDHKTTRFKIHDLCLFKLGIHLGEMWYLQELADWLLKNKRSAFQLTAPPLRLPGSAGSPACPIATV